MELKTYKCPNCGANIEVNTDFDEATCNYCRTTFSLEEENVAKYTVNKIAGIADKIIDNREAAKIRAEEERKERESKQFINTVKYFGLMFLIPVVMWLLLKLMGSI